MPIRAGIGNIANPATRGQGIVNSMWEGLKSGAVSVGVQAATQALNLDPFASSLITRTLSGAISGAISPSHNVFQGVYDAFRQSVGNFSTIPPPPDPEDPRFIATLQNGTKVWNQAAYNQAIGQYEASRPVWMAQALAKTNNFNDDIREHGLAAAVENYATSIFHRDSVESMVQSFGTIKNAITQRMQQNKIKNITLSDGTQAKNLSLFDDEKLGILFKEDPFGNVSLLGVTEDELEYRYQEARINRQTGEFGMVRGTVERTYMDGTTVTARVRQEIEGADIAWVELEDAQGQKFRVTPNSFQSVRLNANGTVGDGVLTDAVAGVKLYFRAGQLYQTKADGLNQSPVSIPEGSSDYEKALSFLGAVEHDLALRLEEGTASSWETAELLRALAHEQVRFGNAGASPSGYQLSEVEAATLQAYAQLFFHAYQRPEQYDERPSSDELAKFQKLPQAGAGDRPQSVVAVIHGTSSHPTDWANHLANVKIKGRGILLAPTTYNTPGPGDGIGVGIPEKLDFLAGMKEYFLQPDKRELIKERVFKQLKAARDTALEKGIPLDVVAHSLGSIAIYDVLREHPGEFQIRNLVTTGSPLKWYLGREIAAGHIDPARADLQGIANWMNVYDPHDDALNQPVELFSGIMDAITRAYSFGQVRYPSLGSASGPLKPLLPNVTDIQVTVSHTAMWKDSQMLIAIEEGGWLADDRR